MFDVGRQGFGRRLTDAGCKTRLKMYCLIFYIHRCLWKHIIRHVASILWYIQHIFSHPWLSSSPKVGHLTNLYISHTTENIKNYIDVRVTVLVVVIRSLCFCITPDLQALRWVLQGKDLAEGRGGGQINKYGCLNRSCFAAVLPDFFWRSDLKSMEKLTNFNQWSIGDLWWSKIPWLDV